MPWRRDRPPTPVFLGFPCGSASKESACNEGDLGLIPGLGRSSGERHGNPLQYSCLENPHGQRGLAGCVVHGAHGVTRSQTRLSNFTSLHFSDSSVGKECACNAGDPSSILGLGRSPGEGTGCPFQYSGLRPGRLQSMGSQRVQHG